MLELDSYPYVVFSNDTPFGGIQTKTAHIFHCLGLQNKKYVYSHGSKVENTLREYGYGIKRRNIPFDFLSVFPKDGHILLAELNHDLISGDKESNQQFLNQDNLILSLTTTKYHQPVEFLNKMKAKGNRFIAIRQGIANHYKKIYDIDAEVISHLWFKYPLPEFVEKFEKRGCIACCRLDYTKKIDMIFDANDLLPKDHPNICKVWGASVSGIYNYHTLGLDRLKKYWMGKFAKNWRMVSYIQQPAKFGINLSDFPEDGGGTENTTLEYIYHGVAVILHRNWIKKGIEYAGESEWEENYNCFAVENKEELVNLLVKDPDTDNITKNAKKIIDYHSSKDLVNKWSKYVKI